MKNQVLVRVAACGICGTDIHIFNGVYDARFPLIPGHECSGTVVALGPEAKALKIGDRIAVDPNVGCGYCEFCRKGRAHLCQNLEPFGVFRNGGFAEFAVIEETHAYGIPESMSFIEGAMVEPLACCLRGSQMGRFKEGDTLLIHGGGAIGNMNMQLARNQGATTIIVSEPLRERRELAKKMGADFVIDPSSEDVSTAVRKILSRGPDVIMECAGITKLVEKSIGLVKRGGTVVSFGCCPIGEYASISPEYLNSNEITLCGSYNNPYTHAPAINAIASGRIDVKSLVTGIHGLEDYPAAFGSFGTSAAMKIVFAFPAA
ncbi:MAG: zinc-dependent alcohol dehydrogenase family protein [Spirochaetes bacterium]|nr:zinc-dependent alcohol dehydrogenase family protein [Spirochaetota bacterium]